jgi:hypothetical protein
MRTDRRTHIPKLILAVSNYANVPKNTRKFLQLVNLPAYTQTRHLANVYLVSSYRYIDAIRGKHTVGNVVTYLVGKQQSKQ